MRCSCCNKALSNQEATAKFSSGVFTDMCNKCLSTIEEDVTIMDSEYGVDEYEERED